MVSAYRREAELLLEMQQEHLLTIRLSRQAIEARRSAEVRLVRSASLPNSILDLSLPSRLAKSPEPSKAVPRSEPCLQKLEASPNSAGAVLGSSRSNGGNLPSTAGSPPPHFVQPKEEAKEPSPCSCQALSPAPSLEAATVDRPELFVGAGPADLEESRCAGTSSPGRAAAGRLPPLAGIAELENAFCIEKPPERGTIGPLADLSPSRRPEIDTAALAQTMTKEPEAEEVSGTLDARLKEVELDRASWRRRTLLLEEQMQRLLQQQQAKEEVRWRPQALQLEEENSEAEAWKEQRRFLETQLAQAVAERERMIEATNELRADVRRLSKRSSEVVVASPPTAPALTNFSPVPSPSTVMRQALAEGTVNLPERRESDRFGAMHSATSSPQTPGYAEPPKAPVRVNLSLPIPAAGTPIRTSSHRPEVEVPGSASVSPSPLPPGWPPPSPETVSSRPLPPPQPAVWSPGLPVAPLGAMSTQVPEGDASPAAMRVRDALKMLSPRRSKSTSPHRIR